MKIRKTNRGYEASVTVPVITGAPPELDDSGEAPLGYNEDTQALVVWDRNEDGWVAPTAVATVVTDATLTGNGSIGDPQTAANYELRNGDYPQSESTNAGSWARTTTDLCSLGGRLTSAGAGSQYTPVYIRAVAVFSGVLSALDVANMNWWMLQQMPNPVPV